MIWAEKENTGEHLHPQFVPHLISGPAQQPRLSNPKVRISSHLPKLLKEIHLLPLLPKVRLLHFIVFRMRKFYTIAAIIAAVGAAPQGEISQDKTEVLDEAENLVQPHIPEGAWMHLGPESASESELTDRR